MKISYILKDNPFLGEFNKYHYFYKIICKNSDEYYYGVHSTKNLNDGYCGSGKKLNKMYLQIGNTQLNFEKQILKFFETDDLMYQYERIVVDYELLKDIKCLNIVIGGKQNNNIKRNYIRMFFNDKTINVNKELENDFLQHGWKRGMSPNDICVYVHNDNETLKIKKGELSYYLLNGYIKGKHKNDKPVCINNSIIEIKVNRNKLNEYLNNGWHIGRLIDIKGEKNPSYNKIWVKKNNEMKYVSKDDLYNYLNDGWETGMIKKNNHIFISKVWVNDTVNNFRINKDELNTYIQNGYICGRIGYKRKITEKNSIKTIWINNGIHSKRIIENDKEKYINEGWLLGRHNFNKTNLNKSNIGKIWINKDNINKRIIKEQLNIFINDGWKLGKINRNIKMKNGSTIQ